MALSGSPDLVLAQPQVLDDLKLEVPFAAKMSQALQQRGVPVGMHVDEASLAGELARLLAPQLPEDAGVGA